MRMITDKEWPICDKPATMLQHLFGIHLLVAARQPVVTDRKLRLFAVACCRSVWPKLVMPSGRACVEVAERFADGNATGEELEEAREKSLSDHDGTSSETGHWESHRAAVLTLAVTGLPAVGLSPITAANLLRDIFGDPFHPMVREDDHRNRIIRTIRLHWLTRDVVDLAQGIYEERIMPAGAFDNVRMNILADALEEAGCNGTHCNECNGEGKIWVNYPPIEPHWNGCHHCTNGIVPHPIVEHLRDDWYPHVRGCWAIDLILKERIEK